MGGLGSTRWSVHTKQRSASDYFRLDAAQLIRSKAIDRADLLESHLTLRIGENQRIPVEVISLCSGGLRFLFRCQGLGGECGRRVAHIYAYSVDEKFACRHCHGLAYTSSQNSRKPSKLTKLFLRLFPRCL